VRAHATAFSGEVLLVRPPSVPRRIQEPDVIRRLSHLIVIVPVALAAACSQLPTRKGTTVDARSNPKIETEAPIDVAVLPVENLTNSKRVPAKELRAALEGGLVQRRYTPLATEYVDKQITDAAFRPGSLQEDATLHLRVEAWDDSLWASHTAVTLRAAASSGPRSSTGASSSPRTARSTARTRR
jgi:hypothetical protein